MLYRPLALLLLGLLAGAAGCSDDDYGKERPVQDMAVVVTSQPDQAVTPQDMATPADQSIPGDQASAIVDQASAPEVDL